MAAAPQAQLQAHVTLQERSQPSQLIPLVYMFLVKRNPKEAVVHRKSRLYYRTLLQVFSCTPSFPAHCRKAASNGWSQIDVS